MSGPAPADPGAEEQAGLAPLDVVAVLAALQDQLDDLTATVQAQQATLDAHLHSDHRRTDGGG
ncbi:MAG: hypothetical protein ACR2KL_01980 [Nocardioidaceae bacterium]